VQGPRRKRPFQPRRTVAACHITGLREVQPCRLRCVLYRNYQRVAGAARGPHRHHLFPLARRRRLPPRPGLERHPPAPIMHSRGQGRRGDGPAGVSHRALAHFRGVASTPAATSFLQRHLRACLMLKGWTRCARQPVSSGTTQPGWPTAWPRPAASVLSQQFVSGIRWVGIGLWGAPWRTPPCPAARTRPPLR
jgi:hypothetical protein